MIEKSPLLLLSVLFLGMGTIQPMLAAPIHFTNNHKYIRYLYKSDRLCDQARRRGANLCEQEARFDAKGRVTITLNVASEGGTYALDSDTVHVILNPTSRSPRRFSFTLSRDESTLMLDGSTARWTLVPAVTGILRFAGAPRFAAPVPVWIKILRTNRPGGRAKEAASLLLASRGESIPYRLEVRRFSAEAGYSVTSCADANGDGKCTRADYAVRKPIAILTKGNASNANLTLTH